MALRLTPRTRQCAFITTLAAVLATESCATSSSPPHSLAPGLLDAGGGTNVTPDSANLRAEAGSVETINGVSVADPFRWLEGTDKRVADWVTAQDEAARSFLDSIPSRHAILGEVSARAERSQWRDLPFKRAGQYFYSRAVPGSQYGVISSYDPTTRRERELLNLDEVTKSEGLVVGWWGPSRDGRYLAVRMSPNGNDAVQARIFEINKRAWLPEHISDFRYSYPSWDNSGRGFYYTWSPTEPTMAADKRAALSHIQYHVLGTDPASDASVKDAPMQDGALEVAEVSPDDRWVLVARYFSTARNSLWLLDRRRKGAQWVQITPDDDTRYGCTFVGSDFFVFSYKDAPNGRVFRVDPSNPSRANWREFVPENKSEALLDMSAIGPSLVLTYLSDGQKSFEVRDQKGLLKKTLRAPPGETFSSLDSTTLSADGIAVLGSYTQPSTPYIVRPPSFAFEPFPIADKAAKSADNYVGETVFYTTSDGTRAPIFLVHGKGVGAPSSSAPLILFAYGAYGDRTEPGYHPGIEAWLDRGGVYAEAVVRGGGEYGEEWHRAGMREKRANVYADFIAASEFLIHEGWTSPSQLVIEGGSAGGLLVTVAETERPELYAGVITDNPITDMIRYPLGGNGPLWLEEFGSPSKPSEFPTLLRYSPYHRVRPGRHYPATLVLNTAEDDRVPPMHSRKFVAALQAADPSARVLLRTLRNAAHTGPLGENVWESVQADVFAFAYAATHH